MAQRRSAEAASNRATLQMRPRGCGNERLTEVERLTEERHAPHMRAAACTPPRARAPRATRAPLVACHAPRARARRPCRERPPAASGIRMPQESKVAFDFNLPVARCSDAAARAATTTPSSLTSTSAGGLFLTKLSAT